MSRVVLKASHSYLDRTLNIKRRYFVYRQSVHKHVFLSYIARNCEHGRDKTLVVSEEIGSCWVSLCNIFSKLYHVIFMLLVDDFFNNRRSFVHLNRNEIKTFDKNRLGVFLFVFNPTNEIFTTKSK